MSPISCWKSKDGQHSKNSEIELNITSEGVKTIPENFRYIRGVFSNSCHRLIIYSKPASVPEQKDLVIMNRFFAILKSPNNFRRVQFIIAN